MQKKINKILVIFLTLLSPVVSSIVAFYISYSIKGRNFSIIGIPKHNSSNAAFLIGIVIYFILSFTLLYFVKSSVEERGKITLYVGLLFTFIYFVIVQYFIGYSVNSSIYLRLF